MLKNFVMPDLYPAAPELFLVAMACAILLADAFAGASRRWLAPVLTMLTLIGCALITYATFDGTATLTFANMFVDDPLSDFLKLLLYVAIIVVLVYGRDYLAARNLDKGEYYLLLLFATLGMMVMISAYNFLTMYLGLNCCRCRFMPWWPSTAILPARPRRR